MLVASAGMAELADALDLGSSAARRAGSSPVPGTKINPLVAANLCCLYLTYVRGEAYLAAGQGTAAAAEFQKIIDHSGIVWNCWTGALAHLGLARCRRPASEEPRGVWMPILPAPGHFWPTRISSRSGKTPTPASPSSSKPRRSTRSCSRGDLPLTAPDPPIS